MSIRAGVLLVLLCVRPAAAEEVVIRLTATEAGRPLKGVELTIDLASFTNGDMRSPNVYPAWDEDLFGPRPVLTTGPDGVGEVRSEIASRVDVGNLAAVSGVVRVDGVRVYPNGRYGSRIYLERDGDAFTANVEVERPETFRVPLTVRDGEAQTVQAAISFADDIPVPKKDGTAELPYFDYFRSDSGWGGRTPTPPSVRFYADTRDGGSLVRLFSEQIDRDALIDGEAVFLQRGRDITGRLSDDVPRPVERGRVAFSAVTPSMAPARLTRTVPIDEDGRFTLRYVPQDARVFLTARCDGFVSAFSPPEAIRELSEEFEVPTKSNGPRGTQFDGVAYLLPADAGDGFELPMQTLGSVLATVTKADGSPAAGVRVRMQPTHKAFPGDQWSNYCVVPAAELPEEDWTVDTEHVSAVTDENGAALLADFPPGQIWQDVLCTRRLPDGRIRILPPAKKDYFVSVEAGEVASIEIVLAE